MAVNAGSIWCLAVCSLVVTAPYVMGKWIVMFKVHADDQLLTVDIHYQKICHENAMKISCLITLNVKF